MGDPALTGVPRSSTPENRKVVVCASSGDIVGAGSTLCSYYSGSGQELKANGLAMSN